MREVRRNHRFALGSEARVHPKTSGRILITTTRTAGNESSRAPPTKQSRTKIEMKGTNK